MVTCALEWLILTRHDTHHIFISAGTVFIKSWLLEAVNNTEASELLCCELVDSLTAFIGGISVSNIHLAKAKTLSNTPEYLEDI